MRNARNIRGLRDIRRSFFGGGDDFPPFPEDLVFDWPSRVDGTLETYERISDGVDNGAFVGGEEAVGDGVGYATVGISNIISDRLSFITNVDALASSNSAAISFALDSNTRFVAAVNPTAMNMFVKNGGVTSSLLIPITKGVNTLFEFVKEGTDCRIFKDGADQGLIGGDFFDVLNKSTFFNFLAFTLGIGVTLKMIGTLSNLLIADTHIYQLNGHLINSVDGVAPTNSGVTFQLNNSNSMPSVLEALNNGYYHETATGKQVVNPQYTLPVGWVAYAGGEDIFHNGINSYFSTNVLGNVAAKFDILDRINQTTASTDSIYYDATDRESRSKYYVGLLANELDITVLDSYMEQADKEKAYTQMKASYCDIQQMSRFFVYATQKTGTDAVQVHNYINNTCQLVTSEGEQDYHLTLPVWIDLTP